MDGPFPPIRKYYQTKLLGNYYNVTYAKVGNGQEAVFAFTGLLCSMELHMKGLILSFAEFGQDYTLYIWDPPGYYFSGSPARKLEDISFEKDLELCAELLTELGHGRYHIMGFSGGGQEALLFAMTYPQFVNKLLIWSAIDLVDERSHTNGVLLARIPDALNPQIAANEALGETYVEHLMLWYDYCYQKFNANDRAAWEKRYALLLCPILQIAGGRDQIVSLNQSESLSRTLKSRLVVLKKAPHRIHSIFGKEFLELVSSFFKETDCGTDGSENTALKQ